jgi:hypothetical protein
MICAIDMPTVSIIRIPKIILTQDNNFYFYLILLKKKCCNVTYIYSYAHECLCDE